MSPLDQSLYRDKEIKVLQQLKLAYEEQGYDFQVEPSQAVIPSFLGNYRPDAIAIKGDEKVVIEVKSRKTRASEFLFSDLQRRIAPESGWRLDVVYASTTPEENLQIPLPQPEQISQQISEIEELTTRGHVRAAFVLSWSLLEAALNRLNADKVNHVRNPGQVVQALASRGYLDKQAEDILRGLAQLRNRTVHGDLTATVEHQDVASVINAVRQALVKEPL